MFCDSLFSLYFQPSKSEKDHDLKENLVINAYLPKSSEFAVFLP